MICHKYKCIFIHQRKTAGTSIITAFGYSSRDPAWHVFNNGVLSETPAWQAKGENWGNYLVFSVIRNPWDRFISGWKYCKSTRNRSLIDVLMNMPQDGHDFRHLTRPQISILRDSSGRMVAEHLLRFERLQQDFDVICDRLGKSRVVLPRLNTTKHKHYQEYFQDERAKILFHERFREDIDSLGYAYDTG